MKERENLHLKTDKGGVNCLINVALKEKKKERKPQFRSLYNVSMVIEFKVVIGWFKLQLWMWLVDLKVQFWMWLTYWTVR